jgi:formylglycine-generating enzyme required for sulfatase activity
MNLLRAVLCAVSLFLWSLEATETRIPQFAPAESVPWKPAIPPKADENGFVLIHGGVFWSGDRVTRNDNLSLTRVEDFELLDHPVTNSEYKCFVDATGHEPPPYWEKGSFSQGMGAFPVVYVNRYDTDSYMAWRSRLDGRVCRLPTDAEFEYAARGGLERKLYPWGDEDPAGRANFDTSQTRMYDSWRTWLRPVISYPPNGYGLYDMAGNVWQMTLTFPDPRRVQYKYRIDVPSDLEGRIVGGSWARAAAYLRCGYGAGASPGTRHPDIGFRIAREPAPNSAAFHATVRRLVAFPNGTGKIFLSWQLLAGDAPDAGFNLYRSARRDAAGFRINKAPITDSTNYEDGGLRDGSYYYYRVRSVLPDGSEGSPSEWAGIEAGPGASGLLNAFTPAPRKTGGVPVFGDLDGDGQLDTVIRLDNGNLEMSKDPGAPVEIEAFLGNGRYLWRRPLVWHDNCFGSASNVPVNLWDLDGDGRAEVICRVQQGEEIYLGILDGMSGRVLRKTRWPEMLTDFAKSSTRIHLSVACLDGRHPSIVTQTGLYENEVFVAYDAQLNRLWEFKSIAETNGSGSHHIDIADVDGDGKDEVFDGTTCLNGDGKVRWSIYREHPDIVAIKDFLPDHAGLEVFYVVESSVHAGVYMVDASSGRILWKINREDDPRWTHAHIGWAADIWNGSPGLECFTNRDGHAAKDTLLLSAAGKILIEPFPNLMPVEWDGDEVRELMPRDGKSIGKFDGRQVVPMPGAAPNEAGRGSVVMVADLAGDFRDEVVIAGPNGDGNFTVSIYSPTVPIRSRKVTRTSKHDYVMWMAHNLTGGYGSYFEPAP